MNKNTNEEKSIQALYILQKDLLTILQNTKEVKIDKTNLFIEKAYNHFLDYGDTSIFKKLFFIKSGKTTLYNRLGLRAFFEENSIAFSYNVKKDSLKIAYYDTEAKGKPLKVSYRDFMSNKPKLTKEEKEKRLFEKVNNLTDDEKARLLAYIRNN